MKITDVRCFPVFHGTRNYMFVKVETDEGLYGMGEFGLTWKEQAGIGAIEQMMPASSIGRNRLCCSRPSY